MHSFFRLLLGVTMIGLGWCACQPSPPPSSQNPSPMVDKIRSHDRIPLETMEGGGMPIVFSEKNRGQWYAPEASLEADSVRLLIHFHGDGRIPQYAVAQQTAPWVLVSCHWGGGSSAYQRPIQAIGANAFLDSVLRMTAQHLPGARISGLYLSSFSAGYGAVRAMLQDSLSSQRLKGVMLLDGLHTSYVPERTVLSAGGSLDSTQMQPFVQWAAKAIEGETSFLLTHSSIFPGTFSSTTETADYVLDWFGLSRTPQLKEGPIGMQQTSTAGKGGFQVLSFAGNTAPDHLDHLHGMQHFIPLLINIRE